jgi:multicomponent K+:H+ antiporter subunit A
MDIALLNAIPLVLAILLGIPALKPLWTRPIRTVVTSGAMLFIFVALLGYFPYIEQASLTMGAVVRTIEWLPELHLNLSFYLDGLALFFALIVTGIGAGIFLYTGYYFDDDAEGLRFTMYLMAFAGAMLGVVLSGNLITMFILWELTSITSFMLIGFKGDKEPNARWGAIQALLITGGGALALLIGLVLLGVMAGQTLGTSFTFELESILSLDPLSAHPYYGVAMLLIVIGAFTKSAQFPFHFWLPNAMSAPTPASAYLHSATMVKAGIFLLLRLYPVLHASAEWTMLLVGIGMLTMFIGAYFSLGKRDLKGILAYLTVSTLGAIVALIGLPEYEGIKAAILMILAHALYKAALFLSVGTIEHNTGTRNVDELGGLRQYMPTFAIVVLISVLSMAGLFPLFGFVAKEVFIDAFLHWDFSLSGWVVFILAVSATFTVTAGLIVFWDVFIKKPTHEIHYHASSAVLSVTPSLLAVGSILFTLLVVLELWLKPLIQQITPIEVKLYLLPPGGLANPAFQISTLALLIGFGLFLIRDRWLFLAGLPLPQGTTLFKGLMQGIDFIGDQVVKSQNGQIRYYLVVIFSAISLLLILSGQLNDFTLAVGNLETIPRADYVLRAMLLILCCAAAVYVAIVRNHFIAALSLGLVGYAIGGMFLLEPAPDVALVQFLVETLATILIIVILSRISPTQRQAVMAKLWKGRLRFDNHNLGVYRDILVAGSVGFAVFLFTLTALASRPEPSTNAFQELCTQPIAQGQPNPEGVHTSITVYHLCNTETDFPITDVVGAIVTDYRGMDTIIEITVFTAAALGVLTLLSRGLNMKDPLAAKKAKVYDEFDREVLSEIKDSTSLSTPFTRFVARLVLLVGFVIAFAHLNYGGLGPGDGFTAGALLALAVSLWYITFGYAEAKERLPIFAPHRFIRAGLLLVMINAVIPIFLGESFMSFVEYDRLLGIYDLLGFFGLHITSTFVYETAIFLTVFGGFTSIMEAIGHPQESAELDDSALEEGTKSA